MTPTYWLLKTEPNTYSFQQLLKDRQTNWNDVRNYQARNFLKLIKKGDLALIYHSGDEKAVVGLAEITKAAYPDPEPGSKAEWVQVDLKPIQAFDRPVPLSEIKAHPVLRTLQLVKQSRLSVMPVDHQHFPLLTTLGGLKV